MSNFFYYLLAKFNTFNSIKNKLKYIFIKNPIKVTVRKHKMQNESLLKVRILNFRYLLIDSCKRLKTFFIINLIFLTTCQHKFNNLNSN